MLGVALVLAVLLIEGFIMRPAREPVSRDIDSAVRRLQTLSLGRSAFTDQRLPYRGEYLDPKRWYFPFEKPFVFRTPGGDQSIFPTLAAAIDVPFEYLGGFPAIRALSIVAMVCAAWLTTVLAGNRRDALLPVLFVLATPAWFYAMGASGPPVSLAICLAGVWLGFSRDLADRDAFWCGALVGIASLLRDENLALLPGLMLVAAARKRSLRTPAIMALGAILPVVMMGFVDRVLYRRPAAAHLLHAVSLFADVPGRVPELARMSWSDRYATVFIYWLDGVSTAHFLLLIAALIVTWVLWLRYRSPWTLAPTLAILIGSAAADTWMTMHAPRRLPGLLRLSPFIGLAAVPCALDPRRATIRRSAQCVAAVFIAVAFLTTNTAGGKSLGPRLLLPAFPFLVIAAWLPVREHLAKWSGAGHKLVAVAGLALAASALLINIAVQMRLFRMVDRDSTAVAREVSASEVPAVVFANPLFIEVTIPAYMRKTVMLVKSAQDQQDVASRFAAGGVRAFLTVGRSDGYDLTGGFDGFEPVHEGRHGPWIVRRWARSPNR